MRHFPARSVVLTLVAWSVVTCRSIGAPPVVERNHVPQDPLGGTNWTLATLHGQEPLPDTTLTLQFSADGTVGGSDGCNHYAGSYTAKGSTIRFPGDFAATMMACPEPVMNQASRYSEALKRAATFAFDAGQLILSDRAGDEVATFAAR